MSKLDFLDYSEQDGQDGKVGTLLVADDADQSKATIYLQIRLPIDALASQYPELNKAGIFLEASKKIQSLEVSVMQTRANFLRDLADAQSASSPPRMGSDALRGKK